MTAIALPLALFDTLEKLSDTPLCVSDHMAELKIAASTQEYQLCVEFLKSYSHSPDTFTAYRREVERLLQWVWLICKKPLKDISRNDIRDYLAFIASPPKSWIGSKTVSRFTTDAYGLRQVNPEWRPFVVKITKSARLHGKLPSKSSYQLSNKSIEAVFGTLSSLFGFLQQENYLDSNPISLIRQKKGYIQRQQVRKVTRRLSKLQWHIVIQTAEQMAIENPEHKRTLFLMTAFYLLGVRISELGHTTERRATMGNFAPDKQGLWWYTTIGKGNKMRDIAVPDELFSALKSYRESLGLTPLPGRDEPTPLFPKIKGHSGLGTRQIRNIVQRVFNRAITSLQSIGKSDEAEDLATATVHWLRHTAISTEIEYRPREHIRDDVGHENATTMDKYIDIDRNARHKSAQHKPLKPEWEETE